MWRVGSKSHRFSLFVFNRCCTSVSTLTQCFLYCCDWLLTLWLTGWWGGYLGIANLLASLSLTALFVQKGELVQAKPATSFFIAALWGIYSSPSHCFYFQLRAVAFIFEWYASVSSLRLWQQVILCLHAVHLLLVGLLHGDLWCSCLHAQAKGMDWFDRGSIPSDILTLHVSNSHNLLLTLWSTETGVLNNSETYWQLTKLLCCAAHI